MAEELHVVGLRDDFYRDSFKIVWLIIFGVVVAISLLVAVSLYLYFSKPNPVNFVVSEEYRIQPPIPVDQRYVSDPDLLQWVTNVLEKVYVLDFYHYNDQLKKFSPYFTPDGWKVFLDQLNTNANYNTVQAYKLFVYAVPTEAPSILNQGLLSGRYSWWVKLPIKIKYEGTNPPDARTVTLQILVVRVPTTNNLYGLGIDDVIVAKDPTLGAPTGLGTQNG